jgi:putative membrane protein
MHTIGYAVAAATLGGSLFLTAGTQSSSRVAARTALDDPTIVAIFDAANTWDIESSTLGEKSHNPEIATLARNFVRDHEMVRQQGRDLAKKLSVTPTPPKDFPLAQVHADAMAKLKTLSGAQFDRFYLENEVAYHKAVIDALNNTLIPAIQNPEFKALAVKVTPAFQAHMIAAQQLLAKQPQA